MLADPIERADQRRMVSAAKVYDNLIYEQNINRLA